MTREECLGFHVYPPNVFYKIPYPDHGKFSDVNNSNKTMLELRGSYGVHVWNKFTATRNFTVGSQEPYSRLASKFCPLVYNNIGTIF